MMRRILLLWCCLPVAVFAQQKADMVIFDGQYYDGETFVPFKEMVIDSGKIKTISYNKLLKTVGTVVIDAKGKYIIPGLTDAHVHLQGSPGAGNAVVPPAFNAHSCLRAGVTTAMDLFSSKYKELGRMADQYPQNFATVLNAGPCITVPGGHGANMGSPALIETLKDAETWAKKLANDDAVDFIKIIYQRHTSKHAMTQEQMQKIVEIAHSKSKKVIAHIDHSAEAIECALAGVDILAHMPMNKIRDGEVDTLKWKGIVIIPTYTVYEASYEGLDKEYASDSLLKASAHPSHLAGLFGKPIAPDSKKEYWPFEIDFMYNLKKLVEKDVRILAGTDAGNYATFYGYALHHELEQYVLAGMTNAQALNTATKTFSEVFYFNKTGKIAEGYYADMLVLTANPLVNIKNTKAIDKVIHRGKALEPVKFD